ncbi:hypothetical protein TUM17387_33850 [Shewanella carassii]|nr:hypothetical protein TUM17387_33850 [Shewanella carassii]
MGAGKIGGDYTSANKKVQLDWLIYVLCCHLGCRFKTSLKNFLIFLTLLAAGCVSMVNEANFLENQDEKISAESGADRRIVTRYSDEPLSTGSG